MKRGQEYFDHRWCGLHANQANNDLLETYIAALPPNGLLKHALDYVSHDIVYPGVSACITNVFIGSLQDDPARRATMKQLKRYLQKINDGYE